MNEKSAKIKFKKIPLLTIGIIAILIFSIIFVWIGKQNSIQSGAPTIAGVKFEGEYQIGNGDWQEYKDGIHIPSTQGDVTLRGKFLMLNPTDGSVISPLSPGKSVMLYFNHIGGSFLLPNGQKISFDAENDGIGEDACAAMWGSLTIASEEPITIILHNPHSFGNENAIDELFENLSIAPGVYHESAMLEKGQTERTIGLVVLISSLIILGLAVFSSIIHIKYNKEMWLIGLMTLFAGTYMAFDAFAVSMWSDSNILNTRVLGISMMLYMLFTSALIITFLKGKIKAVAMWATILSSVASIVCISISFLDSIDFYDTWLWWGLFETAIVIALIICQAISFPKASAIKRLVYILGILTLFAFPLDLFATYRGWWAGGIASKLIFGVDFVFALVAVLRIIPSHINAAHKARELEAEQQALKLELQENRISIMLSQMQPHFIFNTLNTIYHLCEIDPDKARSTISSFSEYLRNNIDNLGTSEMVSFEKELSLVQTYLDIEKVRFDDELEITFDIKTTNFKLPVLTVQPIVENAVKHGTSKKEGVSELYISTREADLCYEIEIRDTGLGFDPEKYYNDGHKHIGIHSVTQRLKNLCNGTLTIDSAQGKGTTVIIQIPKEEGLSYENNSDR